MADRGASSPRIGALAQAGLLAGPFMSMVDSSIVNVALPDIARSLHSTLAAAQWVVSVYLLALGIALPGTAYLAKRFGTRPLYGASLIGFTAASALCAAAPTVAALDAVRAVQGMFGAAMVPLAMNMLFGEGQTTRQMSPLAGMILFLAPALAPALGGLLIPLAGWPAIFLVNVPVGVLALLGMRRIPAGLAPGASEQRPRLDLPGFAFLAGGLAAVTYGSSMAVQAGWLTTSAWPFWSLGLLLLAAYAVWARGREHAIVDLGMLARRQQAYAMVLNAVVSVVTFALIVLVPSFMQEFQRRSAIVAGLTLLPQGITTGLGAVLGNALPSRLGVRGTALLGMAILSLTTLGMLTVGVGTSPWLTAAILSGRGFAIGLVIQPILNRLLGGLPAERIPDGNTLFNVVDRVSGAVGIALIVTFFQTRETALLAAARRQLHQLTAGPAAAGGRSLTDEALPRLLSRAAAGGFHDVIWLVAALSVIGLAMTLGIAPEEVQVRDRA